MNPLYWTIFQSVLGRRRRCSVCGKDQVINRLAKDKRYHCCYCGHPFRKAEMAQRTRERR